MITEYDLYELLGVESSSDQSQIKRAYRALQKRCHPDIAGVAGHHMAIVLNEVYALLSDPASRSAYDQEQAKLSEFRGYTGKPLYSTWFGSENERRAVFVDEVKCVGCLKCALFASKTFAIESGYGRARVVAQWADPEDKIVAAIETCPVDCISMIERSDLAALEFLMSKQPRGNVRMTAGNTGGMRVSNIFADVNKFQSRFHEMKDKASREESKDSGLHIQPIVSAVQEIRSISSWWYWQAPATAEPARGTCLKLTLTPRRTTGPNTQRLREVAAKLKARETEAAAGRTSMSYKSDEEYWTPTLVLPAPSTMPSSSEPPTSAVSERTEEVTARTVDVDDRKGNPARLAAPMVMAVVSAACVGSRGREMFDGGLEEHVGGVIALEVVNSFELQVVLAGATWFLVGMAVFGLFEALGSKGVFRR